MANTINNAALFNQPKTASISVTIFRSLNSDDFINTSSLLFLRAFPTSKKVNSQTREFTSISSFISGEPVPKGAPRMNPWGDVRSFVPVTDMSFYQSQDLRSWLSIFFCLFNKELVAVGRLI